MLNRTIGEIEVITLQQYLLGGLLGLLFISISILNILFLSCFYNLRNQTFVKNSIGVVSLVATDLVNAVNLTPTLLLWFLRPPPNEFLMCLAKSLPFMVSNYTSLLNMTSFCVHRLVVIRSVLVGRFKIETSKYGFVNIVIWLLAIFLVSLPYIIWPNSNMVMLDCRRALFSNVEAALTLFALQFNIPFIIMNVTLLTLVVMLKKYQQVKISSLHDSYTEPEAETNFDNHGFANVDGHSIKDPTGGFSLDTKGVKVGTGNTVRDLKLFDDESTSVVNTDTFKIMVLPQVVENKNNEVRTSRNESKSAQICKTSIVSCLKNSKEISGINITNIEPFAPDDNVLDPNSPSNLQGASNAEFCNQRRRNNETCIFYQELRQFLVTMSILVLVYDVTVLPLIIDINIGASDQKFFVPHVLNSFCFLNSFCNPLIYLIRMKEMRKEMKRLLSQCFDKIRCGRNRNGNEWYSQ